jgi:hypothetical protein
MDVLSEPDWDVAEALLTEAGRNAIENFSANHTAEPCCFCAFSVDYCFGDVVICFDTIDNSLLHAKRHEAHTLNARDTALRGERGWENAKYYLQRSWLCSYNPHTTDFKYPDFTRVHFSDWEGYFGDDQLSELPDPLGHIIVLMHKVIDKLVADRSFDRLSMSSPFRLGVEFPRDDLGLVVMRLLNWPSHQGPSV